MEYATIEELKAGVQIAYIPNHAGNDITHKDVELGFVTSVNAPIGLVFCRFFYKNHDLRTTANSESVRVENLVLHEHMPAKEVRSLFYKFYGVYPSPLEDK